MSATVRARLQVDLDIGDGFPPLQSLELDFEADSHGRFGPPAAQILLRLARDIHCTSRPAAAPLPPEFDTERNRARCCQNPLSTSASCACMEQESSVYPPPLPGGQIIPESFFCLRVHHLCSSDSPPLNFADQNSATTSGLQPDTTSDPRVPIWRFTARAHVCDFLVGWQWLRCNVGRRCSLGCLPFEAGVRVAQYLGWHELIQNAPSDEVCRKYFGGMNCVQVLCALQNLVSPTELCEDQSDSQGVISPFSWVGVYCGDSIQGAATSSTFYITKLSCSEKAEDLHRRVIVGGNWHDGDSAESWNYNGKLMQRVPLHVLAGPRAQRRCGDTSFACNEEYPSLDECTPVSAQLWPAIFAPKRCSMETDGQEQLRIGAHPDDLPVLQLGPRQGSSSNSPNAVHAPAPSDRSPCMLASLVHSWQDDLVMEALEFLRLALREQAPLAYLSVGGLTLAAGLLGHPGCPAALREAAADCVCQSLVSSGLSGLFMEGVLRKSQVHIALAKVLAIGAGRVEHTSSGVALKPRLQPCGYPAWATEDDVNCTISARTLTQAVMALHHCGLELSAMEDSVFLQDLRSIFLAARHRINLIGSCQVPITYQEHLNENESDRKRRRELEDLQFPYSVLARACWFAENELRKNNASARRGRT